MECHCGKATIHCKGCVDGDGDLDLAVLENAVRGGGSGLYILSNQTKTDD